MSWWKPKTKVEAARLRGFRIRQLKCLAYQAESYFDGEDAALVVKMADKKLAELKAEPITEERKRYRQALINGVNINDSEFCKPWGGKHKVVVVENPDGTFGFEFDD